MRMFLLIIAAVAAALGAMAFVTGMRENGSDIQVIAAGVYFTVFVIALGCEGIMGRLEEIRDKDKPTEPSVLDTGM